MFQRWRLKLREAEEAMARGQLEEARSLLTQENLQEYLPGKRLTSRWVAIMADRVSRQVRDGDTSAGWRDLDAAKEMAGETEDVRRARQELIDHALKQAEGLICKREMTSAIACLERLEQREVRTQRLIQLKDVARRLESCRKLCRRGRFVDAEQQVESAIELCPEWELLINWRDECRQKSTRCKELSDQLHQVLSKERWTEVARVSDELLALSPENHLARDSRRRAWQVVGTRIVDSQRTEETQDWTPGRPRNGDRSLDTAVAALPGTERFQLWVDAVGGFLVCLGNELSIGQAVPGNRVEIPIQGDLSTKHVSIRRSGERYLLEPHHPVWLAGRQISETSLLSDGDEIRLGSGILLRYRLPHALSATARLDFISSHRTRPSSDGILLMAESCVLGPQWHNHIVCREWAKDFVLYRQDGKLNCRAMDSFEIDGCLCDGCGEINLRSHITGDDFSLSLEEIT